MSVHICIYCIYIYIYIYTYIYIHTYTYIYNIRVCVCVCSVFLVVTPLVWATPRHSDDFHNNYFIDCITIHLWRLTWFDRGTIQTFFFLRRNFHLRARALTPLLCLCNGGGFDLFAVFFRVFKHVFHNGSWKVCTCSHSNSTETGFSQLTS